MQQGLTIRVGNTDSGGRLDKEFNCDGGYLSPPVEWAGVPEGTKSLALIMWHVPGGGGPPPGGGNRPHDAGGPPRTGGGPQGAGGPPGGGPPGSGHGGGPRGPGGAKYYWTVYNIPPTLKGLPKDVGNAVGKVGLCEHKFQGYEPPCSFDGGDKLYHWTLYALMREPTFTVPENEVTRDVLLAAMKDITLASVTASLHNIRTPEDIKAREELLKTQKPPRQT